MTKTFRTITKTTALYGQVEEYLTWCLNRQSERTIKSKRWHYARLYQETGLDDLRKLTNSIMEDWLNEMAAGGAGAVGLNRAMTSISSLVTWQREMNNLLIPIKLLLLNKAPVTTGEQVFYTREEIERVVKRTDDPLARLMIEIAFDTGLRASELCRLKISEISGQRLSFVAKGKIHRTTFVSKKTAKHLRRHIKQNGLNGYLFPGGHHDHIAYNTLRKRISDPFWKEGFDDFHPHTLRHSFVADLERRGASVEELQAMIGHTSIKSTQIYQHRIRQDEYLRELHKKFGKW